MAADKILEEQKELAKEIESLLINFKKDGTSRINPEYLLAHLENLDELWEKCSKLHQELKQIIPETHPYFSKDLYGKTREIYNTARELISSFQEQARSISDVRANNQDNLTSTNKEEPIHTSRYPPPNSGDTSIPFMFQEANRANNFPKLPPMKIPSFDGNYKDWKTFIDIFRNVIHNNPFLSDIEKMQYLLFHLEGDARRVISHLQLSGRNYETALKLVEARFNNNRKIISTYINTIIDAKRTEHRSQQDIIMLFDLIRECLEGLKNLNCKTDEFDPIIVCIAMRKLDTETLRLFEESLSKPKEMPAIQELLEFLEKRHQVLDCIKNSNLKPKYEPFINKKRSFHTTIKRSCAMCNKDHYIYQCGDFKKLSTPDRNAFISQKRISPNCLAHHNTEKCKSKYTCIHCRKKHHSLLHHGASNVMNKNSDTNNMAAHLVIQANTEAPIIEKEVTSLHINRTKACQTLLPTAMVRVKNNFGQTDMLRALIDPGSQVSLITEEAVQNLKLQKQRVTATILGVGETESARTHGKVKISIQLRYKKNSYLIVEALVLPKLSSLLPETQVTGIQIKNLENLILADPNFEKPSPIDLLLGADVYADIITEGLHSGQPAAQNTKLGWILFGSIPNTLQETTKLSSFLSLAEIDQKLEKFWEIEDNSTSNQTCEKCKEHFRETYKRGEGGRYIVRLPFKKDRAELGESRNKAVARLLQMEKKFIKDPNLKMEYNKFLGEYLTMGHMSLVQPHHRAESQTYYLPHHAVVKEDSTTTKLRVVFDASSKTAAGTSLNDLLYNGPKIQQDLTQILLRWRKHRYVYTADIEKMFRQIIVEEEDRNYQRILWRKEPTKPIQEYMLNTVTYGTAPATYLAVRTLQQLAEDEGSLLPIAQKTLTRDFYVDDMLAGADTKAEAQQLQRQIIVLLNKGGFNLRKWTANDEELLKNIPEDIRETGILEIKEWDAIKTLGIHWDPKKDEFHFKWKYQSRWLAPITIRAKLLMQSLWKAGTDWDQNPPSEIANAVEKIEEELHHIESIKIPRWFNHRTSQETQLHGFCDASEKAYAAAIYARTVDSFGKIHVTLLTAKTKVSPLKLKISLPRLELCGALLLAQLLKSTINALEIASPKIFAWCDSEIALAWIAKNPNNWQTFVANRVGEIQTLFDKGIWRHVSSPENPADIATTGISPTKLITFNIWWRGPLWLAQPCESWPSNKLNIKTDQEAKKVVGVHTTTIITSENIFRCSSYTKQLRVIAYVLRFIKNCRLPKPQRKFDYISFDELQCSRNWIIKIVQLELFSDEIHTMVHNKPLKKTSKLLSLHPFIDTDGIMRVGGRLKNSGLSMDAKHQILLPQGHHITNLVIDYAHQQTLHGGTHLTLNYIRTRFWIIDGKRAVQGRIHKCIRCLRHRQKTTQPLMGNLPAVRITPSPPFSHCGVDYAGPFLTKISKGRVIKTTKGYISLFVCMVTKAIHLELVSDLSTDAFLAAYRRFVARRGNCKQIFSDNGTNFVGARNKMDKDLQLAITRATKQAGETILNDGTEWKFIPIASPHFGGLWEAGVKSVKGHLKRVLEETLLTYEEFSTVLYQIEACLNSRPIGQLSSDPTDLEPLTPGHFLIGRPLIAPPEPHIDDNQIHQRWKLVTKLHQDIWKRWSQEYLSSLQQRSKWRTDNKNPSIGELVLLKDDNLPPQKWSLGRIVQLHPGEDGIVRIVSVKYKNEVKKRPINKICQLPLSTHNSPETEKDSELRSITTMTTISLSKKPMKIITKRKTRSHLNDETELWSKPEHFDQPRSTNSKRSPESMQGSHAKRTRIAPCTWASRLVHSTLLIFFWLTAVFAQNYEIFYPSSGFYVERLGSAQVKRGNLRLQVSLPINEVLNDQRNINATWTQIRDMCEQTKKLTQITHCLIHFQHLSTRRYNLLRAIDEILRAAESEPRSKRGVLGRILTSIFGVNDEIYTDIEVLQHNQQNLLHSTSHQMLMLNTKINQSNFVVLQKLRNFDARLSQVIASINEMSKWISSADHNRLSIEVISTYLSAEDYYDEVNEKYNHWLNAVHNKGHLLDFVSLHDINNVIQTTSDKIGSNFEILSSPQNSLDIKKGNKTIKLYGYLNTVERSTYEVMHITPTPHLIQFNKFAIADVRYFTIAINFNDQTYFELEEQELKDSPIIGNHLYLCSPRIVHNIENSPSCVIDEIYNRHPKTTCEMHQLMLNGTVWKALMKKNTWLYITSKPKAVAVICKGLREELVLNNTGIIQLHENCYIKTREIILKSSLDQTAEVLTSHIKELVPEAITINFNKPPSVLQPGLLLQPNEGILDYSMEPDEPTTILQKILVVHSITATTTVIIFLLALLIWKYWSSLKTIFQPCHLRCHNEHNTSSPEPEVSPQVSIQRHFDRVLSSGPPQHVHN